MFTDILQKFAFPLFLAPMESVTDETYRMICKEFGADVLVSEFISSEALIRDVRDSKNKLSFNEVERPIGIQIFGHNEDSLCRAAEIAAQENPDFIDINWGCPVKKVVSKGAGAAILKTPDKMVALTQAVVKSVSLPVTVKTRLGWDETDRPIVELAERLQDVGVQAITIHGRTRSQMYLGQADWTLIGEVCRHPRITIPIIGNGDINSAEKAVAYKNQYGVDGIMIGRTAIGNPWIFRQVKEYLRHQNTPLPSYAERVSVCLRHLQQAATTKPEKVAVLEMRRHYAGYFKGIPNFKETKIKLMQANSVTECADILLANIDFYASQL